jgi:hypothetical protein
MSLIKLYVILGMDVVAKIIECHDFRIISSLSNTGELLVLESILISMLKPFLNKQGRSIPLSLL